MEAGSEEAPSFNNKLRPQGARAAVRGDLLSPAEKRLYGLPSAGLTQRDASNSATRAGLQQSSIL